MKGRAHKLGDDINTDYVISGKYKFKTLDMKELAKHLFEDLVPGFADKVRPGDIVVAGRNFGHGSSREQAPLVLKEAGISCVVAESFARIFYRNAINVGLPAITCDTGSVNDGDVIEVDLEQGRLKDLTTRMTVDFNPLPPMMARILEEGGLANYIRKHGELPAEGGR